MRRNHYKKESVSVWVYFFCGITIMFWFCLLGSHKIRLHSMFIANAHTPTFSMALLQRTVLPWRTMPRNMAIELAINQMPPICTCPFFAFALAGVANVKFDMETNRPHRSASMILVRYIVQLSFFPPSPATFFLSLIFHRLCLEIYNNIIIFFYAVYCISNSQNIPITGAFFVRIHRANSEWQFF